MIHLQKILKLLILKYALLTYTHGKLNDYIGSYHSDAYYFDDYSYDITDSYYDLEELLEVLKKRSDVVLFKGGKNGNIIKRPYAHGKGNTIKFLWIPSEDDYKKCIMDSGYLSLDTVPEKIFGVKKLR
jgi:alpha-L-fucosidase